MRHPLVLRTCSLCNLRVSLARRFFRQLDQLQGQRAGILGQPLTHGMRNTNMLWLLLLPFNKKEEPGWRYRSISSGNAYGLTPRFHTGYTQG
eukprot:SAG31_NODE_4341_length_3339_cov_1.487346_4_plen_92_part_00